MCYVFVGIPLLAGILTTIYILPEQPIVELVADGAVLDSVSGAITVVSVDLKHDEEEQRAC